MGFWNALSALAPVAPALSDAQDIRTQRQQEAAKFAQDQQLKEAQLTAQKLAAEGEQQRITQGKAPVPIPGIKEYYDPAQGSWMQPSLVNGSFQAVKIPGRPAPADELKQATAGLKEAFSSIGQPLPSGLISDLGYHMFGGTGSFNPNAGMGVPRSVTVKGPDGKPMGATFWGGRYYGPDGEEIAAPEIYQKPAAQRPLSPSAQYTNLLAKKLLADRKQGPPLTNEEAAGLEASKSALDIAGITRAQAFAQAAAQNHLQAVTDPETGQDTLVPVSQAVAAAKSGQPYLAGVVSAPTGMDKKNQMLAQSAIAQIDTMERILAADPNLTGPGAGQVTKMQNWLGSGSEDAQQFLAASTFLAEHGVGVFGGRNIHSIQDLQNLMGDLKTNPAALKAALEQARQTMQLWATAGGRLPGPRNAAPSATGGAGSPGAKQHSLRTAMALPFNKGKTAAQVKADLEAHGYTVTP